MVVCNESGLDSGPFIRSYHVSAFSLSLQQENRQFVGRFSLCDKSGSSKPHLVLIGVNKTGDMICQKVRDRV